MKFRFPAGATVPDTTFGAVPGARIKVRDAIIQAAGDCVHCEESKRGHRRITVVHLEPGSAGEAYFKLALPTGIHPDYRF